MKDKKFYNLRPGLSQCFNLFSFPLMNKPNKLDHCRKGLPETNTLAHFVLLFMMKKTVLQLFDQYYKSFFFATSEEAK
jgi:hypothetical protein